MILRNKIPEAISEEENLVEYLEVCEQIFQELKNTISLHDFYKDYKNTPEGRLALLSKQKNFEKNPIILDVIIRGIIRDINQIYTTNGTRHAVEWVFKVLGWDAKIETAWLIDPELFFPSISSLMPIPDRSSDLEGLEVMIGIGDGESASFNGQPFSFSTSVSCSTDSITNPIGTIGSTDSEGDTYKIGVEDQLYIDDPTKFFPGHLRIGYNVAYDSTDYEDFESTGFPFYYDKLGYKNFVFGEAQDDEDGVYFYGRTFESQTQNVNKLRIVKEVYPENQTISDRVVMATPYIGITLKNLVFSRFVREYTASDSESDYSVYEYDDNNIVTKIEGLLEFLLYDLVRAADVKVLILAEVLDLGTDCADACETLFDTNRTVYVENPDFTSHEVILTCSENFSIDSHTTDCSDFVPVSDPATTLVFDINDSGNGSITGNSTDANEIDLYIKDSTGTTIFTDNGIPSGGLWSSDISGVTFTAGQTYTAYATPKNTTEGLTGTEVSDDAAYIVSTETTIISISADCSGT